MAERTLVVDHLKLSYEGLFNAAELFNLISHWFFVKNWDWSEKMNEEQVTPSGRQIRIILEPWKSISDYHKLRIKIKINYIDVKDVDVEHAGELLKLNHGLVRMTFDAYVVSDRHGLWRDKPLYWLLSILASKYFFREHQQKAETWVRSDLDDLHHKIKDYLNVFKYTYQNP